jgi:hypothetical protein
MFHDALRFFRYNWQHYSLALWGLRLRLDPDYPLLTHFFPGLIADSVQEYRTYGGTALWAIFLAYVLPLPLGTALVLFWLAQSVHRSQYFRSNLTFWRQASHENGFPHRAHARYSEQLLRDIERRVKSGESFNDCREALQEAQALMDKVCAAGGVKVVPPALQ